MSEYNIGTKIKQLRKAKKLTLQDVANDTGFSTALISQIENHNISPPIATLSKIAKFFDIKLGVLFAEADDECRFEVVRSHERIMIPKVISQDGANHGFFYECLFNRKKNKKMEPFFSYAERESNEYQHLLS